MFPRTEIYEYITEMFPILNYSVRYHSNLTHFRKYFGKDGATMFKKEKKISYETITSCIFICFLRTEIWGAFHVEF